MKLGEGELSASENSDPLLSALNPQARVAARVAAQLKAETDAQVQIVRGGVGELSVYFDDRKVIDTNRFWYPSPMKLAQKIQQLLTAPS